VQPGDTLGRIAQEGNVSVDELARASGIANPDRIHPGDQVWIPGAGARVEGDATFNNSAEDSTTPIQNNQSATGDAGATANAQVPPTPEAHRVDQALQQVQAAEQELAAMECLAANGNPLARSELRTGDYQQTVNMARNDLTTAIDQEITSRIGAQADDAAVAQAGQAITDRYGDDPAKQTLVNDALTDVRTDRQVNAIVNAAQQETDPVRALQVLNDGYAAAPQHVQDAILADPQTRNIIEAAAEWANEPLAQPVEQLDQSSTRDAIARLDQATQGLDKDLAASVVNQAADRYESIVSDPRYSGLSLFGQNGMKSLMDVSGRIAGTPQGDRAIERFVGTGAWNDGAVYDALAQGGDPTYAIAFARHLEAMGSDASRIYETVTHGVQQFKENVANDVRALAEHNAELSWMVQNLGPGLTQEQLDQAIADYRSSKGDDWIAEDARLRQQVADDGTKLIRQMAVLNEQTPPLSDSRAAVDETLKTIANDPVAGLAISTAIQTNPDLADPQKTRDVANLFMLSKIGDIGRKYANEMASAALRKHVIAQMENLDPSNPASVEQVKRAIESIADEDFARQIGVAKGDLNKAVRALQSTIDDIAAAQSDDEVQAALRNLDHKLNTDAALVKSFNKTTVPGQLIRGVGLAFAGASVINSANKVAANPDDWVSWVKLATDSVGFAQKGTELLVGLGKVDEASALGQFGGGWKYAGRASVSDFLGGVSVALDVVNTVRYGLGLGAEQNTANAFFSASSAVGGGLTLAPAFGAPAVLGPIGLGVTAVTVIGKSIYDAHKDAHQYESASRDFLKSAGYDDEAAQALSRRGEILSGATGGSQMPFLAKYAEYKNMTAEQMQDWVNSLTPDQVEDLSKRLLQTAGDSEGDVANFTDGPAQSTYINSGGWPVEITLANTVGVFEDYLRYDQVPLP
jgi:hypothetical protein